MKRPRRNWRPWRLNTPIRINKNKTTTTEPGSNYNNIMITRPKYSQPVAR
jgi:hypothetical protein